jgi:RimJ/RimL family protein N-acetyltransferase
MAHALTQTTLAGDGLLLRPLTASDAAAVTAACQDPAVQRWTSVPVPYTPEDGAGYCAANDDRWAEGLASFGIFDAATGALLGSHGIVRWPVPGVAEVGFWVAAQGRGRGVATSATRLVAHWALRELGAHRVEWQAEVGNTGSRRVAEKAGFSVEGVLRARLLGRAGPVDAWVGGLLASDLPPG